MYGQQNIKLDISFRNEKCWASLIRITMLDDSFPREVQPWTGREGPEE